jgi:hypothetical protein
MISYSDPGTACVPSSSQLSLTKHSNLEQRPSIFTPSSPHSRLTVSEDICTSCQAISARTSKSTIEAHFNLIKSIWDNRDLLHALKHRQHICILSFSKKKKYERKEKMLSTVHRFLHDKFMHLSFFNIPSEPPFFPRLHHTHRADNPRRSPTSPPSPFLLTLKPCTSPHQLFLCLSYLLTRSYISHSLIIGRLTRNRPDIPFSTCKTMWQKRCIVGF